MPRTTLRTTLRKDNRYADRLPQWQVVRDAIEGDDAVKAAGVKYLPRPKAMASDADYEAYKSRANFINLTDRTLEGLGGLAFRVQTVFELPDPLESYHDMMTTMGLGLDAFIRDAFRENMSVGRYGVLLDVATAGAELPVAATYKAEDILDWEVANVGGRSVLTMVELREATLEDSDGEQAQEVIRASLDESGQYQVQRFQQTSSDSFQVRSRRLGGLEATGQPVEVGIRGNRLDFIPFVFMNPRDTLPDLSKPPLLDLARLNVAHYVNSSELEQCLHMLAQPTPWVTGVGADDPDRPTTVGPTVVWYLPEGATAGLLEFSGAGISAIREAMHDKEGLMAALGANIIAEPTKSAETAETTRLKTRGQMSVLENVVQSTEEAAERVLRIAAEWVGLNPQDVQVRMNRDFVETRMAPQEITAMVAAWQANAFSYDTLFNNLKRGEIVDPKRTIEEELDAIEAAVQV